MRGRVVFVSSAPSRSLHTHVSFVGAGGRAVGVVGRLSKAFTDESFRFVCAFDDPRAVPHTLGGSVKTIVLPKKRHESSEKRASVSFVVCDLSEPIGQKIAREGYEDGTSHASTRRKEEKHKEVDQEEVEDAGRGFVKIGVALMPERMEGEGVQKTAAKALRGLKEWNDSVIVVDAGMLRQEGLAAAQYLTLHEAFLDMIGFNLASLAKTLQTGKKSPHTVIKAIGMRQWRSVFAKHQEDDADEEDSVAYECRLVTAQIQSAKKSEMVETKIRSGEEEEEEEESMDRGKTVLRRVLTDPFFPLDDVSRARAVLVSIEGQRDLKFGEVENLLGGLCEYVGPNCLVVQGLSFPPEEESQGMGLKATVCVVYNNVSKKEQQKEAKDKGKDEDENDEFEVSKPKKSKKPAKSSFDLPAMWKSFKEWF